MAHMKNKSMVGCWGDNTDGKTNVPQHIYGNTNKDDKSTLRNSYDGKGNKDENED